MKKRPRIIAITTGDSDGIGLEVTMKALPFFVASTSIFLVFRGPKKYPVTWQRLPEKKVLSVDRIDAALMEANSRRTPYKVIEVISNDSPAEWVRKSALLCLKENIDGMVTGPVSKKTFLDSHLGGLGHTPLLKQICGSTDVYMGFLGSLFNVVLLTGHIPLVEVEKTLTKSFIKRALNTISHWQKRLPENLRDKPYGILGLNPHSGENGLIGSFEKRILNSLVSDNQKLRGPLVPDAAFAKENWDRFSFYLALYHDQGLIPFKMIHGHAGGAHVSIGLPIVRTSVDHGTAIDIFGKGLARPNSMKCAIQWCESLIDAKG